MKNVNVYEINVVLEDGTIYDKDFAYSKDEIDSTIQGLVKGLVSEGYHSFTIETFKGVSPLL